MASKQALMPKAGSIRKYLKTYGTPEANQVAESFPGDKRFSHSLALPLCGELLNMEELFSHIKRAQGGPETIIIAVVNHGTDGNPSRKENNLQTIQWLKQRVSATNYLSQTPPIWYGEGLGLNLLVVERVQPPYEFTLKQGVGLARKIGCDCAAALIELGIVKDRWIRMTDGDARIPYDYFQQTSEKAKTLIYRFRHIPSNDSSPEAYQALMAYECWLRYYRLAMVYCHSPNQYHAIGSLIAVRAEAYAEVRGFSKKRAGEDFYLLSKLRKTGPLHHNYGEPIHLKCRLSDRVPFGTGQGTIKILGLKETDKEYTVYHPAIFDILSRVFQAISTSTTRSNFEDRLSHFDTSKRDSIREVLDKLELTHQFQEAISRSRTITGARREFFKAFDSFRTLKLVHALRDEAFPNLPLIEALNKAPFLHHHSQDLSSWLDYLIDQDERQKNQPQRSEITN